jgi:hypothetical protein
MMSTAESVWEGSRPRVVVCRGADRWGWLMRIVTTVVVLCLFMAAAGCADAVGGRPAAVRPAATVQDSVVTIEEASLVLGSALSTTDTAGEPAPAFVTAPPSCAAAAGPGTTAAYRPGWTVFWSTVYGDGPGDHTVTQTIGTFADAAQAATVFRTVRDGVRGCPTAVRTDDDGSTSRWAYRPGTVTPTAFDWTAAQDAGDGWTCYRQVRVQGRSVLQVAVCGVGDLQHAVVALADRFVERVSG